jgi:hypothetical protein
VLRRIDARNITSFRNSYSLKDLPAESEARRSLRQIKQNCAADSGQILAE